MLIIVQFSNPVNYGDAIVVVIMATLFLILKIKRTPMITMATMVTLGGGLRLIVVMVIFIFNRQPEAIVVVVVRLLLLLLVVALRNRLLLQINNRITPQIMIMLLRNIN